MNTRAVAALGVLAGVNMLSATLAADPDEFRIKREAVFEFVQKPVVTREGDKIAIAFESKGFCDAVVAMEDRDGRIVRHLAGGVLGPNAPEPFQKDSKKQVLLWDGKNDKGEYVDEKDSITVRVSLGLKAQYERNLMWCPKKRGPTVGALPSLVNSQDANAIPALVAASPEGVYVFDGEFVGEHVRLFDHEGNYVRTVYPPSEGKIQQVQGLKMLPAPSPCPLRWNQDLVTMLTIGDSGYGGKWPMSIKSSDYGLRPQAMAVRGSRLVLAAWRVNRLATDGSSGGLELEGPGVTYPADLRTIHEFQGGTFPMAPRSAAIEPKGEWLYLTGYAWHTRWHQDGLHGVIRLRVDGKEPPQVFAGDMKQGNAGRDDAHLCFPLSAACDSVGRVYVCDYMNDRVQIFSPSGELLKTLRVPKPVQLDIHPRSGELFVFSWLVMNAHLADEIALAKNRHASMTPIPARLTRYEPIDWTPGGKEGNPKAIASFPLPLDGIPPTAGVNWSNFGLQCRVGVDFWAREPIVWISQGADAGASWKGNIRLFAMEQGKLKLVRDFAKDVEKEDIQPRMPYHGRQRLYFDHRNEKLYVGEQFPSGEHIKSFKEMIQLDPVTGKGKIVPLPFDCEDLAFDMDGHAYLRTLTQIARYEAQKWREVPFDYGEEKQGLSASGAVAGRKADKVNAVIECRLENNSSSQQFGMWVSPKGHIVITGNHRSPAAARTDEKNLSASAAQRYEPRIYPGRPWGSLVHIFDKHGRMVYDDALPGTAYFQGIAMDKDDDLYIQHSGLPPVDGKFPPNVHANACTLMKLKPKSRFIAPDGGIIPLPPGARPDRPADLLRQGTHPVWIERAEWMYGGVGISAKASRGSDCHCFGNSRFGFDYFARSFVSELDRYRVTVLDSNGNVILRIGRYGNADDGKPLVAAKASPAARSIGGDEVALMQAQFLATQTDRRLFVADIGNYRIFSVKLDYHAEEKVALKDVKEGVTR